MIRSTPHSRGDQSMYYIVVTTHAALLLYKRNSPYAPVPPGEISKLKELTREEKDLIAHFSHGPTLVHPIEELFVGLERTKLPIAYSPWEFQKEHYLTISRKEKLETALHLRRVITARGTQETFYLSLLSTPNPTHADKPLIVRGEHVLFFGEHTLSLSRLPEPLSTVLSKIRKAPIFPFGDQARQEPYQHVIEGVYLGQLDMLMQQLREHTDLTLDPALAKLTIAPPPKLVLAAMHDSDPVLGERFTLTPMLDWGHVREDISATYYRSSAGGKVHIARRAAHMHYITEDAKGRLTLTLIPSQRAEQFYRLLFLNAKTLGLSPALECRLSGEKRINLYFMETWNSVIEFAHTHDITLTMNNSELSNEHAVFRADFSVQLSEKDNELSFDVACYVGDQKVNIDALRAFIEEGGTHLILDNGTSVQIDNHSELARFVRMLRSFHQKAGTFTGKLYHAPELKYVMTCSSHYNNRCADSFQMFMTHAENGTPIRAPRIPEHLETIMRPYQKEGVAWLEFLRSYRFGGILADDMGLGKTLQALAFLSLHKTPGKPHLVICPKTLIYNWASEAKRFTPDLNIVTVDGTQAERSKEHRKIKDADIVITSYSALLADAAWHLGPQAQYDYVLLDEAQYIKNHTSKTSMLVKRLNAEYRLALTGTPLENNVMEVWSIMDFLMPGFLGGYKEFTDRYSKPIMLGSDTHTLEQLRKKISVFMLRRTKQEVLKELPEKIEQQTAVPLSADQRILYAEILAQVKKDIETVVAAQGFARSRIHILSGLMKLRQVCNHPALLLPEDDPTRDDVTSAKLDLALELIDEAIAPNTSDLEKPHKVLVFSQFTGMLDLVSKSLKDKGVGHMILTGKTQRRGELVDAFNVSQKDHVFLISTKAGGTGLNLASADTVIVIDPWWNPSVERQAIDRAHRIGQTRTVNVYRLITAGTIEEKIQALQAKKKDLFDAIVNETGASLSALTWDDVKSLFSE